MKTEAAKTLVIEMVIVDLGDAHSTIRIEGAKTCEQVDEGNVVVDGLRIQTPDPIVKIYWE